MHCNALQCNAMQCNAMRATDMALAYHGTTGAKGPRGGPGAAGGPWIAHEREESDGEQAEDE